MPLVDEEVDSHQHADACGQPLYLLTETGGEVVAVGIGVFVGTPHGPADAQGHADSAPEVPEEQYAPASAVRTQARRRH